MQKSLLATATAVFVAFAGAAVADTGTFTASGTTQAALTVDCSAANLRFGTIAVEPTNAQATVTVAASSGATATSSSSTSVYPAAADSGPAACAVTNETGVDATASLSAPTGTFAGTTLSGVTLSDGAVTPTLSRRISSWARWPPSPTRRSMSAER